ncbi:Cytochrome c556 [Thiohalospira halophila DSM 15071]|uniref:Cytochrome c556 n=1 Tax=Thiohalospira halophila DSM 15071 TaxID=1123397 RepID=A0A1I1PFZ2_9GAMM|nr:cytochrome c [Thiohalospira halophila]SFD04970.1 Cytochrome c556 [Thiohalospira halophila DSM 15071]
MRKLIASSLVAATAFMGASSAMAEKKDADYVEYRQGVFTAVAWNFGPLVAMAKGEIDFDADLAQRNAERIAQLASMPLEGFRGGPHDAGDGHTHAKDAIWENMDKFEGGMEKFQQEADELAEVAQQGELGPLRQQVSAVGESCKKCHDNFKED